MEEKQLTEEQKQKFAALKKSMFKKMLFLNLKFIATLVLANFVVAIINVTYVQSKEFSLVCTILTCFMSLRSFLSASTKEHDRVKEEIAKILES